MQIIILLFIFSIYHILDSNLFFEVQKQGLARTDWQGKGQGQGPDPQGQGQGQGPDHQGQGQGLDPQGQGQGQGLQFGP